MVLLWYCARPRVVRRCCLLFSLALLLVTAQAQTGPQPPSPTSPASAAAPQGPLSAAQPMAPSSPQAMSPTGDTAAFVLSEFGPSFKLDRMLGPFFADLDGDGSEDVVLVATSAKPLADRERFQYKVEDPYDEFFGSGDVSVTSEFNLHIDGSERDILIIFDWRHQQPARAVHNRRVSKFVLINTPFETASITTLPLKKKTIQAVEVVDRTREHAVVIWDGKRWHWEALGMSDDEFFGRAHGAADRRQ